MTTIANSVEPGHEDSLYGPFINGSGISLINTDDIMSAHVTGIEFFEKQKERIVEHRNGELINHFPNTEFALYRQQTGKQRLVMLFGESWCYGGKIRDMIIGSHPTEGNRSLIKAVTTTVGPRIAQITNSDLFQSAWPGNNTTDMFTDAEAQLPNWTNKGYNKILVVLQITDPHRCANSHWLHDTDFIRNWTPKISVPAEQPDLDITVAEWLYMYDRSFLVWADALKVKYPNADFVVWKNFSPWCVPKEERDAFKCKTPDVDWTSFNANLEGLDLDQRRMMSNPALIDRSQAGHVINWCPSTTQKWCDEQLGYMETLHDYWDSESFNRLQMNMIYPNEYSHKLWAMHLSKAGGWK